jgi:pimeloyl-ACP methyl ester carboxylesterase
LCASWSGWPRLPARSGSTWPWASDPLPHAEERFAEAVADDMLALLDFLGCERVAVLGLGVGPPTLFAASHPERTRAFVQLNTGYFGLWGVFPTGAPDDELEDPVSRVRRNWGTGASLDTLAPSAADDDRLRRWLARCQRLTCTADEAEWRLRATRKVDLRAMPPLVQVPTLVLHREGASGRPLRPAPSRSASLESDR